MRQKERSESGPVGLVALMKDNGLRAQSSIFERFHNSADDRAFLCVAIRGRLNMGAARNTGEEDYQS